MPILVDFVIKGYNLEGYMEEKDGGEVLIEMAAVQVAVKKELQVTELLSSQANLKPLG